TNRDPLEALAAGALREDLYYRLNVFPIDLPSLREKREDVPLLVAHFLQEIGQREGGFKRTTPQVLEQLVQHRWPGNVRELRNILQRAYVMSAGDEISESWLPQDCIAEPAVAGAQPISIDVGMSLAEVERKVVLATLEHFGQQKERTAAALGISLKTLYNRLKEYGM
ncbi:MAG TPA: helix-turn-helix domain-containing protein, partial [Ramlibacter sp.]|nr:helix-turn-helix domain-containing protein [Ramlibacter sp.]